MSIIYLQATFTFFVLLPIVVLTIVFVAMVKGLLSLNWTPNWPIVRGAEIE